MRLGMKQRALLPPDIIGSGRRQLKPDRYRENRQHRKQHERARHEPVLPDRLKRLGRVQSLLERRERIRLREIRISCARIAALRTR